PARRPRPGRGRGAPEEPRREPPPAQQGHRLWHPHRQPRRQPHTSRVDGVDSDLRVRPFFAHGGTISIREFIAGAFQNEMGLQVVDPELVAAAQGGRVTTPAGMVLDGATDKLESPPTGDPSADPDGDGVAGEIPTSIVDFMEFYLLNYLKPGAGEQTSETQAGRESFRE